MDSFLFAVGAVAPIVLMVAIGYFIKRIRLVKTELAVPLNKLVFRIFLPVMLFLNIYRIGDVGQIDLSYILYAMIALAVVFALSIPAVILLTKHNDRRGVLLQGVFRSNYALIGIPLAQALFGEGGLAVATLLSAVAIPAFNILAVISLSVFSRGGERPSVKKIILGIVKNPLIQGIAAGLAVLGIRALFVKWGISFRLADLTPIYTVLGYLGQLATPLALLALGIQFEFSAVKSLKREIIFGTLARTVIVPALCIGIAYIFFYPNAFNGAHFAAFVAMFTTPVAVSSVPMAQEMEGDVTLAGQLVVWTMLSSTVSIFLAAFLLRLAGVF